MPVASFKFTAEFLIEAFRHYRLQHRGRRVMLAIKVFAVLFLAPLGVWAIYQGQVLPGVFFAALCALMFFAHRIDHRLARRSFRKSPYCDEDMRIELSDAGFQATSSKQDTKLQWSVFTKVVHFRDGFLLFQGPRSFNWIPVSTLAKSSEVAELETLLRSKITEHIIVEPVAVPNGSPTTSLGNSGLREGPPSVG